MAVAAGLSLAELSPLQAVAVSDSAATRHAAARTLRRPRGSVADVLVERMVRLPPWKLLVFYCWSLRPSASRRSDDPDRAATPHYAGELGTNAGEAVRFL